MKDTITQYQPSYSHYNSTSRHYWSKTGGFCRSKVLLPSTK